MTHNDMAASTSSVPSSGGGDRRAGPKRLNISSSLSLSLLSTAPSVSSSPSLSLSMKKDFFVCDEAFCLPPVCGGGAGHSSRSQWVGEVLACQTTHRLGESVHCMVRQLPHVGLDHSGVGHIGCGGAHTHLTGLPSHSPRALRTLPLGGWSRWGQGTMTEPGDGMGVATTDTAYTHTHILTQPPPKVTKVVRYKVSPCVYGPSPCLPLADIPMLRGHPKEVLDQSVVHRMDTQTDRHGRPGEEAMTGGRADMPSSTNDRDSSSMQRQSGNKGTVLACGPLPAKLMRVHYDNG